MENQISSNKFWQCINKNKKIRYTVIAVFMIITIPFGIIGYIESKREVEAPKELSEIQTMKTDEYVFIDVADKPNLFAEKDKNQAKFYFIWDVNDKLYIVEMFSSLATKLEEATTNNPIRILGTTKEITSEIKDLAISGYNRSKTNDSDLLIRSEFENQVGTHYLWVRDSMTYQGVYYFIGGIFFVFGLSFLIAHLFIGKKIKRIINKLSPEEANLISIEVENDKTIVFEKASVFITENYVISMIDSLLITKISDIVWVYFTDIKQNGVLSNRRVDIFTSDNKNHWISVIPFGKTRNTHLEIIDAIANKNPKALVGFTDENRKVMKEAKKEYKNPKK